MPSMSPARYFLLGPLQAMQVASSIDEIVAAILGVRFRRGRKARLIAISGIDGSGKSYVSTLLAEKLTGKGLRVALIAADGWLNLPHVRFGGDEPGEHFYSHAFRFEEMFPTLIDPLVRNGRVRLLADLTEETATAYRKHLYSFEGVDVVLLEGIFLFKQEHQQRYDFRLWIDCSFETALERALVRSQEGLASADTVAAYDSIYFPAERVHFERDAPRDRADLVYVNDAYHPGSAAHQADFLTAARGNSTNFPR
jgi:uridine kinase